MSFIPLGEEIEEHWADNDNVAIIDFLDSVGQPTSCAMWGSVGNADLPTIIDDGSDYNFHDEFIVDIIDDNIWFAITNYTTLNEVKVVDYTGNEIESYSVGINPGDFARWQAE